MYLTCVAGDDEVCIDGCACRSEIFVDKGTSYTPDQFSTPYVDNIVQNYFLFGVWSCLLGLGALFVTNLVSVTATGSGIPRIKSVLSGVNIHHFLSLRTLLGKSVGLALAFASGIPIGREGPYVHLACCVATLLMRLPIYSRYRNSSARRVDMLTAACATGVAAAFGTPFGGVIFAVEVVSLYFYVPNLPRMFLSALSGTFIVKMLHSEGESYVALFKTQFKSIDSRMTWRAFVLCITIGIVAGILAGLFVKLVAFFVYLRRQYLPQPGRRGDRFRRYLYVFAVILLVVSMLSSTLTMSVINWLPSIRTQRALITRLFLPDDANTGEIVSFACVLASYFFLVAACVVLPIPAGMFIPTLLIGALLGRIVAEIAATALMSGEFVDLASLVGYEPGVFAVVGAAAFAAGATRAISSSLIVVEVTGQPHLLLPVSIGVLAAFFVSNRVSKPAYDTLLEANAFPSLRKLSYKAGNVRAHSIMHRIGPNMFLTLDASIRDANRVLNAGGSSTGVFPVVDGERSMLLVGEVQRRDLVKITDRALDLELEARRSDLSPNHFASTPDSKNGEESSKLLHRDERRGSGSGVLDDPLPFAVEKGIVSEHFEELSVVQRRSRLGCAVTVDPSPICVSTATTIHKVDVLFRALRLSALYLHDDTNVFVGWITRKTFMSSIKK